MNSQNSQTGQESLPKLGHVHLNVANLERALTFYTNLLGLKLVEKIPGAFCFLSFGEAHHDLALREIGPQRADGRGEKIGLYHTAFELHSSIELKKALKFLQESGRPTALVDHGISWALYTEDPDGNGVELFVDRRQHNSGRDVWHGASRSLAEEDL